MVSTHVSSYIVVYFIHTVIQCHEAKMSHEKNRLSGYHSITHGLGRLKKYNRAGVDAAVQAVGAETQAGPRQDV